MFNDAASNLLPKNQEKCDVLGLWQKEGIPVLSGGDVTTPFELLCGARSLENFFLDLITFPDKITAVMDEMIPHLAVKPIQSALKRGFPMVWVGGWRAAPAMLSPEMWDRFVWIYLKRLVTEVIDAVGELRSTQLTAVVHPRPGKLPSSTPTERSCAMSQVVVASVSCRHRG